MTILDLNLPKREIILPDGSKHDCGPVLKIEGFMITMPWYCYPTDMLMAAAGAAKAWIAQEKAKEKREWTL